MHTYARTQEETHEGDDLQFFIPTMPIVPSLFVDGLEST